jgi:Uma2 family endonuclease
MATTTSRPATEADLLKVPEDGYTYELVDGEIRRMSPAGWNHGLVCLNLGSRLLAFVKAHNLGHVSGWDPGVRLPQGNLRAPDIGFVASGRFEDGKVPKGYTSVIPDLAVEVLSPEDRPRLVLDKIGEFLEAGVRLVWVIDPDGRRATVYRSISDVRTIGAEDELDGEDVLPGFRCGLAEVLE